MQPPSLSPSPKQIPFKQIKPVKFMGLNSSLPFNSLISESKLLYLCGRSIILQNIRTYEQKIIWTNEFCSTPQVIEHIINIHRQNIVGIAIKDDSNTHLVIIMNINSQINNYEHLNKREREKDRLHYLKNLQSETTTIQKLKFLHEGSLFAVIVSNHNTIEDTQKIQMSNKDTKKSIYIYSSLSGDLLYKCEQDTKSIFIEGLQLNRLNYTCILKNEPEQKLQDNFLQTKKAFYHNNQKDSSSSLRELSQIAFFKMTLLNSSELSNKSDFLIQLRTGQCVMEIRFFQNHKRTFAFLLLNTGFVLIYMVNQRGFHDCIRVDVKIDKIEHMKKMKRQKDKTFFSTQKTEQCDPGQRQKEFGTNKSQEKEIQGNTIDIMLSQASNERPKPRSTSHSKSSQPPYNLSQTTLKPPQPSIYQRTNPHQKHPTEYYYPTCICCTSCKVAIGYEGCSFIGVIKYSAVDHKHHKFWYIFDFFYEKTHIDSIRKIAFSEDGCHCSVLVKTLPNMIEPAKKKRNAVKIDSKFKCNNDSIGDRIKQSDKDGSGVLASSLSSSPSGSKLNLSKSLTIKEEGTKEKSKKRANNNIRRCQKKATTFNFSTNEDPAPLELLDNEDSKNEKQHFCLMHLDFISGMIQHEYHNESIEESLTSSALQGTVEMVEFNQLNNTMLILMKDNRLFYYFLNPTSINGEKDMLNCGRSSLTALRKKLQSNNLFTQKSIANYLSPESVLLWVDKVRFRPFLILCHPTVFELVLVLQDSVKFHFYNYDKMFESHHVLSLKNCKAASYSPYGDKLALGTVGNILLVDSYTHQVIKKISLVIFPTEMNSFSKTKKGPNEKPQGTTGRRSQSVFMSLSSKTVSRIQYINNDDLMIQTGNTTLSMLLNYDKVIYYGSTSEAVQGRLFSYDYKHRMGVVASDTCVKVITKCSINSKNKCEELAKIDLTITAVKLCGDIDILFLGGANGVLYFVRWPQFFQNDVIKAPNTNNKLYLFHTPIIAIRISINYKQLFVLSSEGMIVICELTHSDEVQKIGKDVSFRMSKKIDLPLPLLNKWLISTSDQEKRAQNITKLMGNEAEIKNNEQLLAQDYKSMLEQKSQNQKQFLEEQLKTEIKKYEIDSGISKLQMEIAFVRDEIKRVAGKREVESKTINEKIDEDLHEVFVEREKLEQELNQLKTKSATNKSTFISTHQTLLQDYKHVTALQITQQQQANLTTQKMFESKMKIDRALEQNLKQDFFDELYEIQKAYTQELQQLYLKNNNLTSENRNKKVQMLEMTDKMRELSARMYELESDVHELESEQQAVHNSKRTLSQQILETDKKYHSLIKKTKEIEISLNRIRASSEACQLKFNDLEKEMEVLEEKWSYLEERREENQIDFIEQFKLRNYCQTQVQEVKERIKSLKVKRKQVFENKVLLKDLIKPYEKQLSSINRSSSIDESEMLTCIDSSVIEVKKTKTNKLTSDVEKWSQVKDDNKLKFIKYNEKLQYENNKLIYRFNELQKQYKQLNRLESNVKRQISMQKLKQKESMSSNKWERFSFVSKQTSNEDKYQKPISLSIHRSLEKNQFNTTSCHFSSASPKSFQRQTNQVNKFKKVSEILKLKDEQREPTHQLNKRSSKNLQSLFMGKTQQFFKERQSPTNNQSASLYHGVTLDKTTLKPKKTLCLSLHKDGEESGKFVTEY